MMPWLHVTTQVQLDGIGAAISNLQYFHRSIDKTYTTLEVSASCG